MTNKERGDKLSLIKRSLLKIFKLIALLILKLLKDV